MNIAIIGAGIAGTATAFELASHGMQVDVFERRSAVAEEGSFAGSGLIAASLVRPLELHSPVPIGFGGKINPNKGINLRKGASLRDFLWRYRRLSATADQATQLLNTSCELISISQSRLREILKRIPSGLEQITGQLMIFRTEALVLEWQNRLDALKERGIAFRILTPQAARKIEPGLSPDLNFHSAILFEQDEVVNGRQLAQLMKDEATSHGARFHFATPVVALEEGPVLNFGQNLQRPKQKYDAVVMCCSSESAHLLNKTNSSFSLYSLMGYSVSGQIQEPLNAPRSAVFDAQKGISFTRVGNRVRVAGGFEMGRADNPLDDKVINNLYKSLLDYFPGAIHFQDGGQTWRGKTSFSEDGLPLVGPTNFTGVWINAGHGMSGLAMANACAVFIRDGLQLKSASSIEQALYPSRFQAK